MGARESDKTAHDRGIFLQGIRYLVTASTDRHDRSLMFMLRIRGHMLTIPANAEYLQFFSRATADNAPVIESCPHFIKGLSHRIVGTHALRCVLLDVEDEAPRPTNTPARGVCANDLQAVVVRIVLERYQASAFQAWLRIAESVEFGPRHVQAPKKDVVS